MPNAAVVTVVVPVLLWDEDAVDVNEDDAELVGVVVSVLLPEADIDVDAVLDPVVVPEVDCVDVSDVEALAVTDDVAVEVAVVFWQL